MAKDVRELDDIDTRIVTTLRREGRLPNNALADEVGIAASTCLTRLRSLVERGVIAGFHAEVDPAWFGRPIQAMIAVRLRSDARASINEFSDRLAAMTEVLNVYFLAGADDFHVHVAARDPDDLRAFVVDNLSSAPEVALTETNLIFEHKRGRLAD
ncbi:MAG: AsnC family transcriptional regulator [Aeromicrobium sp.]|jgi:DNA-binding Lrp family transcriptional regulator|uniref:Lrp/AsnC family transcriptional regulator n=1 Tax=Aeromicrobium sp. TaxID=1871063 RepID=UPI00262F900C|nr:Lrp/AsnC family transcriptional regulator [Aeromicrobium sp.]MCW2789686.1 AsnC family transcriptional regulator [Aeromicrobium sp.]MCW2823581.1 AsnC family transcriptional regulator [Aeromicrobium sp.]